MSFLETKGKVISRVVSVIFGYCTAIMGIALAIFSILTPHLNLNVTTDKFNLPIFALAIAIFSIGVAELNRVEDSKKINELLTKLR